jgi:peptidyl-prolyl cis-trans isomerase SurA
MAQKVVYTDSILAKVNGKVITRYELNELTQRHQAKIASNYAHAPKIAKQRIAELKESALKQYIENVIILDEFKTKQFNVPKSLIDKELEKEIKTKSGGDRQKFIQMLDSGGISMEEYREQINESIAIELMISENVKRKVNVTPVDISRYYNVNKEKFLTNAEIKGAVIALIKGKEQSEEDFNKKITMVTAKLKDGDFAKIADEFSDLTGKPKGGDMGFKKASELNEVFKNALNKLSKNEVSAAVKLDGSVFFFKLLDKRGGSTRPLLEVRDSIKNYLEDTEERKYYKEFITQLRKKASIEDFTKK